MRYKKDCDISPWISAAFFKYPSLKMHILTSSKHDGLPFSYPFINYYENYNKILILMNNHQEYVWNLYKWNQEMVYTSYSYFLCFYGKIFVYKLVYFW